METIQRLPRHLSQLTAIHKYDAKLAPAHCVIDWIYSNHIIFLTCLYSQFLFIIGALGFLLMELDLFPKL